MKIDHNIRQRDSVKITENLVDLDGFNQDEIKQMGEQLRATAKVAGLFQDRQRLGNTLKAIHGILGNTQTKEADRIAQVMQIIAATVKIPKITQKTDIQNQ